MINNIHNDDCFNIFPQIGNKTIDLVLVDLPYGQTALEWDVKIDLGRMWKELKRICGQMSVGNKWEKYFYNNPILQH